MGYRFEPTSATTGNFITDSGPATYAVTGNNGNMAAWRLKADIAFNPRYGYTARETWTGPPQAVLALYNFLTLNGYRVQISTQGPLYTLTVDKGADPNTVPEVPVDHWTIDMEAEQVSVWKHPAVNAALFSQGGNDSGAVALKKQIMDSVNQGKTIPPSCASSGPLYAAWRALVRGQTAYEIKRPVLGRQRSFSLAYAPRMVLDQVEKIYDQSVMQKYFAVPNVIFNQLPVISTLPPPLVGTAWAWKVNTSRAEEVPALNKVQENTDWIFNMWSTDFYQLIAT